jgi:hypothetical protein
MLGLVETPEKGCPVDGNVFVNNANLCPVIAHDRMKVFHLTKDGIYNLCKTPKGQSDYIEIYHVQQNHTDTKKYEPHCTARYLHHYICFQFLMMTNDDFEPVYQAYLTSIKQYGPEATNKEIVRPWEEYVCSFLSEVSNI